jgi:predicted glycosyltransferase involved in capsule biosynthesis
MNATILIGCYCRPEYLRWHLESLLANKPYWPCPCRVVVLNDGIHDETESIAEKFGVDYLFTGSRNDTDKVWRCPGFALNIGIKQYQSDIIILSCAEMYHLGDTLSSVIAPVIKDKSVIGTPIVYDDHGPLLKYLQHPSEHSFNECVAEVKCKTKVRYKEQDPFLANPFMPYFIAIRRHNLISIGGYDEDFIGKGADDNDLMDRLLSLGCHYEHTPAEVVHVNHGTPVFEEVQKDPRYQYNVALWKDRKGMMIRNLGRDWGKL